jgi:hypothetical protein
MRNKEICYGYTVQIHSSARPQRMKKNHGRITKQNLSFFSLLLSPVLSDMFFKNTPYILSTILLRHLRTHYSESDSEST